MKKTIYLVVALLFSNVLFAQKERKELLLDNGFEERSGTWIVENAYVETPPGVDDSFLVIPGKGSGAQRVSIPSGTKVIKVEGYVNTVSHHTVGKAFIEVRPLDESGNTIATKKPFVFEVINSNSQWVKIGGIAKLPSNTAFVTISCESTFEDGLVAYDNISAQNYSTTIVGYGYADELPLKQNWLEYLEELKQVIKNGSFEKGLENWPDWAGELTEEEAHDGNMALKVEQITDEPGWIARKQKIMVDPNAKALKASGWMKTEQVFNTPADWEGARIYIEFHDMDGAIIKPVESVARAIGTTPWTKYEKIIELPEGAKYFLLHCGLADVPGTAFFDELKMEFVTTSETEEVVK